MSWSFDFVLHQVVDSITTGFSILSLLYFFTPLRKVELMQRLDHRAIWIILIILPCISGYSLFLSLSTLMTQSDPALNNRLTGPYAVSNWFLLLYPIALSQSLWIRKWRKVRWFRTIMALLFLFSMEKFVIIISTLHRDYIPANWILFSSLVYLPVKWAIDLGVFMVICLGLEYIRCSAIGRPFWKDHF